MVCSNSTPGGNGGGIDINTGSGITISGPVFNNSCGNYSGSGIFVDTGAHGVTINGAVYNNTANTGGSAVLINGYNCLVNGAVYSNSGRGMQIGGYNNTNAASVFNNSGSGIIITGGSAFSNIISGAVVATVTAAAHPKRAVSQSSTERIITLSMDLYAEISTPTAVEAAAAGYLS